MLFQKNKNININPSLIDIDLSSSILLNLNENTNNNIQKETINKSEIITSLKENEKPINNNKNNNLRIESYSFEAKKQKEKFLLPEKKGK